MKQTVRVICILKHRRLVSILLAKNEWFVCTNLVWSLKEEGGALQSILPNLFTMIDDASESLKDSLCDTIHTSATKLSDRKSVV